MWADPRVARRTGREGNPGAVRGADGLSRGCAAPTEWPGAHCDVRYHVLAGPCRRPAAGVPRMRVIVAYDVSVRTIWPPSLSPLSVRQSVRLNLPTKAFHRRTVSGGGHGGHVQRAARTRWSPRTDGFATLPPSRAMDVWPRSHLHDPGGPTGGGTPGRCTKSNTQRGSWRCAQAN